MRRTCEGVWVCIYLSIYIYLYIYIYIHGRIVEERNLVYVAVDALTWVVVAVVEVEVGAQEALSP